MCGLTFRCVSCGVASKKGVKHFAVLVVDDRLPIFFGSGTKDIFKWRIQNLVYASSVHKHKKNGGSIQAV